MPAPATVPEFLDLVRKSGVADEARLAAYLDKAGGPAGLAPDPQRAAGLLVRDALLTYFQAEQLLQGKWKRFSIGKYKVLERLGSGGMAQVFLCEHKLMRRRVAVKVLPTAKAADQASIDRFYREARAVAAVDHPNIVRAYDIDQDENLHFLVMEYVDGTNLQDLVKKQEATRRPGDPPGLAWGRACHYIYGSAVGLQHAHEIGLIHRDIKPGNILIDRAGVVKVLDLGLARIIDDNNDNITRQYDENILGTADYLSPEQAEDSHTVDIRTDIYSLGATFYYLLTGGPPFPDGTIPQKLIWHRMREPKPVREFRSDVPDAVLAVLAKMTAKKPADRYQTPAEVVAALQPFVAVPIGPPADAEMPVLSPLVAGPQAARAAAYQRATAASAAAPAPGSGVRVTESASMGFAEVPVVAVAPPPAPAGGGNGVWESLGDDVGVPTATDTARTGQTGQTVPEPTPVPRRARPARTSRRPLLLAAGAVLLAAAGAGGYYVFLRPKPDPVPPPGQPGPRRLVVARGKAGQENTFPTLAQAVAKAAPGDVVAVEDDVLQEVRVQLKNKPGLTIESGLPDGRPVTAEGGAGGVAVFDVDGCEGFKLRGFTIDARGGADYAAQLSGVMPGAALENVTVLGGRKGGVRLLNVAGGAGRPVVLDRVRVALAPGQDAGVRVDATTGLATRGVSVRHGRFDGPGKVGVLVGGGADGVDVTGNRFFRLDAAVLVNRPTDPKAALKLDLSQNTVVGGKVGFHLAGPPAGAVVVGRNYFAQTAEAAIRADGDGGVAATHNARSADARPGNVPVAEVPTPLPPTNPGDDATFLRFPTPPTLDGRRVGAE